MRGKVEFKNKIKKHFGPSQKIQRIN